MAEVIRDVVIRVRTEMADDAPFKRMAAEQNKAVSGAQKLNRQYKDLEAELGRTQRAIQRTVGDYLGGNERAAVSIEALIKRERQLEEAIKARNLAALRASRGTTPGGRSGRFSDDAIGRRGVQAHPALAIASAAITVAMAPKVILGQITELTRGITADIRGGQVANQDGFFTSTGKEFLGAYREFRDQLYSPLQKFLDLWPTTAGLSYWSSPDADRTNIQRPNAWDLETRSRMMQSEGRSEMQSALERQIALEERLNSTRLEGLMKQHDLARQTVSRLEDAVKNEEKLRQSQAAQFGLLTKPEQDAALRIAGKLQAQGIDALTGGELDFARRLDVFDRTIQAKAAARAEASGFPDLRRILGEEAALQKAKIELEAAVKIASKIEVEIKNNQAPIEELKKQLDKFLADTAALTREEIARQIKVAMLKQKAAHVPGF